MHFESISLENFKNYRKQSFDFVDGINCIVGRNGSGKTNLLDAIHMISFTKSAFNHIDQDLILNNQPYLKIKGLFNNDSESEIEIRLKQGEKKQVFWKGIPYEKLSEHIGKIPLVLINPNDTDIIRQGSEIRRRFIDSMISVIDHDYLKDLSRYQRLLRQRNAYLKQLAERKSNDRTLIESYNEPLLVLNKKIAKRRLDLMEYGQSHFKKYYKHISDNSENVDWQYSSKCLDDDFAEKYVSNLEKDIVLQRTNMGIHKDEFHFLIEEKQIKKFGSQGQQKSCVLALKLVQFSVFEEHFQFAPILLLDDIFDKLDSDRMKRLMDLITSKKVNQVFVTDAHPERSVEIFKLGKSEFRIFEIKEGELKNVR